MAEKGFGPAKPFWISESLDCRYVGQAVLQCLSLPFCVALPCINLVFTINWSLVMESHYSFPINLYGLWKIHCLSYSTGTLFGLYL